MTTLTTMMMKQMSTYNCQTSGKKATRKLGIVIIIITNKDDTSHHNYHLILLYKEIIHKNYVLIYLSLRIFM